MTIYRSHYAAGSAPTDLSLPQFLNVYNADDVPADKIIFEDDCTASTASYGELRKTAARCAWCLRHSLGVMQGKVFAICALNSVDHIKLIHAAMWTGATVAYDLSNFSTATHLADGHVAGSLISPYSTPEEVLHCFQICRPTVIAVDAATAPNVISARSRITNPPGLVSLDDAVANTHELLGVSSMFAQSSELPVFDLSTQDNRDVTAFVCFSSGTSGKAKGVKLTHHNLIASLMGIRATDPTFNNSTSRSVFFAPLCHIYGLNSVALTGAWLGTFTLVMKKYSLEGLIHLSAKIKANTLRIVPPVAIAMSQSEDVRNANLDSIRFILCAGATVQPSVISFLQRRFPNAPIFQGYGMTETNIATLRPHLAHKVGSVGRLFANVEARLVDDDLVDVAPGEEGELLVRGPTVFQGYMNNPSATREAFHQGWLRTGDVLRSDAEGFLYLTGRKKELIKYKGHQVAPAELEAILMTHPYVEECAVCGRWDEEGQTELPVAYIKLSRQGQKAHRTAPVEIAQMVSSQVSSYKRLRGGVMCLEELPKTSSGKILKRLLGSNDVGRQDAKL